MQNNIRLKDPHNLEKAMSLVMEEENFYYSQNQNTNLNLQTRFKPTEQQQPFNNNKILRYPTSTKF